MPATSSPPPAGPGAHPPTAPSAERDLRGRLLDAAEQLFYARGIQAVGMDEIRRASGLPLKRIYQLYPGKQDLVLAFLRRRDQVWLGRLSAYVEEAASSGEEAGEPVARVLAVFDWLYDWFAEPGFRGCAWINAHGELGAASPAVAALVREHKQAFAGYLERLVEDAAGSPGASAAIFLLAEGAMVTAGISGDPRAARDARRASGLLLRAG